MSAATLEISEARKQLNSIDERLRRDDVVYVTRHGKPVFALVDLEHLSVVADTLEIMSDPAFHRKMRSAKADVAAGRLHDHDDVEKELG